MAECSIQCQESFHILALPGGVQINVITPTRKVVCQEVEASGTVICEERILPYQQETQLQVSHLPSVPDLMNLHGEPQIFLKNTAIIFDGTNKFPRMPPGAKLTFTGKQLNYDIKQRCTLNLFIGD